MNRNYKYITFFFFLSCAHSYKVKQVDGKQMFQLQNTLELVYTSYIKACVKEKKFCDIKQKNIWNQCKEKAQKHTLGIEEMLE